MGYVGFQIGLLSELVKLTALTVGFFVSFRNAQAWGSAVASRTFLSEDWAVAFTLVLSVVGIYWLATRALRFLDRFAQVNVLEKLDQVGGLGLGCIRGVLTASVLLVVLQQLPSAYLKESINQHSLSGSSVVRTAPAVCDFLSALPRRLLSHR